MLNIQHRKILRGTQYDAVTPVILSAAKDLSLSNSIIAPIGGKLRPSWTPYSLEYPKLFTMASSLWPALHSGQAAASEVV